MNRLEYNLQICDILKTICAMYPDWRFTQILTNIGLDRDRFYEEPKETLAAIKKWLKLRTN